MTLFGVALASGQKSYRSSIFGLRSPLLLHQCYQVATSSYSKTNGKSLDSNSHPFGSVSIIRISDCAPSFIDGFVSPLIDWPGIWPPQPHSAILSLNSTLDTMGPTSIHRGFFDLTIDGQQRNTIAYFYRSSSAPQHCWHEVTNFGGRWVTVPFPNTAVITYVTIKDLGKNASAPYKNQELAARLKCQLFIVTTVLLFLFNKNEKIGEFLEKNPTVLDDFSPSCHFPDSIRRVF